MCLFHKWGKWEQYSEVHGEQRLSKKWVVSGYTSHMQKKQCDKCGKVKLEKIGETVH